MTPISSLIRTTPHDHSHLENLTPSSGQHKPSMNGGNGNHAVSFLSTPKSSQINFGGQHNSLQQPQGALLSDLNTQADPLTQLISLIQGMLQRMQALMQGGSDSGAEPANNAINGAGSRSSGVGASPSSLPQSPSGEGTPTTGKKSAGSAAPGNFSAHTLGNQLSVQKSPEDSIGTTNDPERGNVIKVDFNKGHFTEHSTSPRAEIKDGTKLQEGQPYSFKFGMKREANNDGTFFQVLDHNNAKPSPRAWLATKDGQYQLHLKTSEDSKAPSKVFNIGKPGDAAKDVGKWADFQIDFKRGIGNGEISVTKNGENVFDKKGISTMFDTHSSDSYAKFGQYRNEGDHRPATSLFSGFSVAKG